MNEINKKLAAIQKELKAPKSQFNSFGNYNYRSCEDILEAVKPLLKNISLTISDEIVNVGDRYYVQATAKISDGVEAIVCVASAREPESKKGMDESQITGSTSSYARKYALNGLFAIDDTKDADTQDNREEKPKKFGTATSLDPYTKYKKPVSKPVSKPEEDDLVLTDEALGVFDVCEVCKKEVTPKVAKYSKDKYGKVLCMTHQLANKETA